MASRSDVTDRQRRRTASEHRFSRAHQCACGERVSVVLAVHRRRTGESSPLSAVRQAEATPRWDTRFSDPVCVSERGAWWLSEFLLHDRPSVAATVPGAASAVRACFGLRSGGPRGGAAMARGGKTGGTAAQRARGGGGSDASRGPLSFESDVHESSRCASQAVEIRRWQSCVAR